jgi:dTDP-4-amino-4,6-dideoxygalactose transaminase
MTAPLPLPSDQDRTGRDLGSEELGAIREVLETGVLVSTKGRMVARLQDEFAARHGARFAWATSSGSAAVHVAVAAVDPEPGDEIVTSPITDMGALTPILYQGAIPVFCDVDPDSYNVTAETIEPRLTARTRAVIVTHLFGVPCDLGPILELCGARGIPVIEDCAQAFDATWSGRPVGTLGRVGCFSFQQGKHMTTGEGGIVLTSDPEWSRRMFLFINKAWGYGDDTPDHYFLALNYRMNEITGALGVAQLRKLSGVVARRRAAASRFLAMIEGLPGLRPQAAPPGTEPSWWKLCLNVDEDRAGIALGDLASRLRAQGIHAAPRYIGKPAFECRVFRERATFGRSSWPYSDPSRAGLPPVDHDRANFPGVVRALSQVLVLPWSEFYEDAHLEHIAGALAAAVRGGARRVA